ncbi:MAG: urease accessory protein UreD [Alphaproteobacteria bacterium]|nr:urease accessory protein UreD [Alphaproteobacteria bacterium]
MYAATSRSETPIQPSQPLRLQRLHGAARVGFAGPETRLTELYQANPCRVLLPRRTEGRDGRVEAVLLNTAGGVTDGDQLQYSITAQSGAQVTATTQAAEKIYRSRGADSHVQCHLAIGDGAFLEWLPQETILFNGGALARQTHMEMDGGSRLLAMDWLLLGRLASGERLTQAAVRDRWRLRRDGRLIWADDFRLQGDIENLSARPALLAGARALATLIYVASDAADYLAMAKGLLRESHGRAGASERPGLLICRFLAPDGLTLRRDVEAFLLPFRAAIHGRPHSMPMPLPRVWAC